MKSYKIYASSNVIKAAYTADRFSSHIGMDYQDDEAALAEIGKQIADTVRDEIYDDIVENLIPVLKPDYKKSEILELQYIILKHLHSSLLRFGYGLELMEGLIIMIRRLLQQNLIFIKHLNDLLIYLKMK